MASKKARLLLSEEEAYREGFTAGWNLIEKGIPYEVPKGKNKKERCWLQGALDGAKAASGNPAKSESGNTPA